MFGRHTDYHGTRAYSGEAPNHSRVERSESRASTASAWIRLQIEKFLRAGAPPDTTTWLVRDGERHFTTLGLRPAERKSKPKISDIFPIPTHDQSRRPREFGRPD